jgi:hypothetical protein
MATEVNGWSNFETWKIWHEVFSFYTPERFYEPQDCLRDIEEILELDDDNTLKNSLVYSWLTSVNWMEIAVELNEQLENEN